VEDEVKDFDSKVKSEERSSSKEEVEGFAREAVLKSMRRSMMYGGRGDELKYYGWPEKSNLQAMVDYTLKNLRIKKIEWHVVD